VALYLDTDATGAIAAGTPVFFTITLEDSAGDIVDESWLSSLRFETPDAAPVSWPLRRLGAAHAGELSGTRFIRVRYGLDPDTTTRIAPGTYAIRVAAQPRGARVVSDGVRFQVAAPAETLSSEQSLQIGRFHLEAQQFDRAHAIALKLVEAADSTEGYIMLGDAFTGLGRHEEALAAYLEALASIKTDEGLEPPDRILRAIERAREARARQP
jgi:hypothetical protein